MLWTAYLMILKNDGLNERQLRECAQLDSWLRAFWFEEDITMWLFWFLLRPGASHPPPLLDAHN
ncbi:hypothetical protein EDB89DRAFT_2072056 [Lactarius sanguifluus]|nr:hypothetical protein EDB89DRAFT_2072056 [Lactarius sanguifluus]